MKNQGEYIYISIHALREEGDAPPSFFGRSGGYFYPRPPRGGRHFAPSPCGSTIEFLSTPSARRATTCCKRSDNVSCNFYPRPPRGGRPRVPLDLALACHFYPRPPRGGRRLGLPQELPLRGFLSTPSARRATPRCSPGQQIRPISIHALREEGDVQPEQHRRRHEDFYPRPPRGGRPSRRGILTWLAYFYPRPPRGGRRKLARRLVPSEAFLSTPSARRATRQEKAIASLIENFYPRPPRGGRRRSNAGFGVYSPISIHALREEGDSRTSATASKTLPFLSTPSARRATCGCC